MGRLNVQLYIVFRHYSLCSRPLTCSVFIDEQQARQGKVPEELVERLQGILGHIMRPNTLKVDPLMAKLRVSHYPMRSSI